MFLFFRFIEMKCIKEIFGEREYLFILSVSIFNNLEFGINTLTVQFHFMCLLFIIS